jgi:hypothetical protein
MSQVEIVIRREGMYDSYGLGEVVIPGVALFRAGNYNLTKEELNIKLKQVKKAVVSK